MIDLSDITLPSAIILGSAYLGVNDKPWLLFMIFGFGFSLAYKLVVYAIRNEFRKERF